MSHIDDAPLSPEENDELVPLEYLEEDIEDDFYDEDYYYEPEDES